jgi:hypothetical protein
VATTKAQQKAIKGPATAKKYGVRFGGSKRIVWCKDYWDAERRLSSADRKQAGKERELKNETQ